MQHGVVHYAVGNMPGAVPYTSTYSLTNATLPYQLEVARLGALGAITNSDALRHGLNTARGHITNDAVARELNLAYVDPLTALS
jgi:alanine dehydrogenase